MTSIALLRGINVGGKNKLPMQDLARILEELGCEGVKTYIQSGNAVFRAPSKLVSDISERLSKRLSTTLAVTVPVVLRSGEELARVIVDNPFLAAEPDIDVKTLHVAFLADAPTPAAVRSLDPDRSPGDRFAVVGREIYLHCPNGLARTKLTNAYFDRVLSTVATIRNWKTTLKLAEMSQADADES